MTCTDTIPDCDVCASAALCEQCKGSLELPDCTKITNCKPGAVKDFVCGECVSPYTGPDCRGILNCKILDQKSVPYCLVCNDNYKAENGVCVSICVSFSEGGGCSSCKSGYFARDGVCTACSAVFPECSQCSSARVCTVGCGGHCAQCFGAGSGECVKCMDGFRISGAECVPCDKASAECVCGGILRSQCRYCGSDGFRCGKCITNYRLNRDMTVCVAQPYGVAMGFSIALALVVLALAGLLLWQCIRQRESGGQDLFSKEGGSYELGSPGGRQLM